ncbi:MAG: hypothetical protein J6X25_09750 [Bacteroidales bacterium]|nr:hypothetical protein [Bacteroidales bacterium]
MKRLIAVAAALLLAFQAFSQAPQGALVAMSSSMRVFTSSGNGVILFLTNVDTGEEYRSRAIRNMSKDIVVEDLPAGKYIVTYMDIPFGSGGFVNKGEEVGEYFGILELEAGKAYYLGTYKSKYAGKFPYMKVVMYYQGTKVSKKLGRFATKAHYDGWTFLEPSVPYFTVVDLGNQTRDSFSYTDNFD